MQRSDRVKQQLQCEQRQATTDDRGGGPFEDTLKKIGIDTSVFGFLLFVPYRFSTIMAYRYVRRTCIQVEHQKDSPVCPNVMILFIHRHSRFHITRKVRAYARNIQSPQYPINH